MKFMRSILISLGLSALSLSPALGQSDPSAYQVKQEKRISDEERVVRGDKLKAYSIHPISPQVKQVEMPDTLTRGTHSFTSAERRSTAVAYLGNTYSPWQSKIFFDRAARLPDFVYFSGFQGLLFDPEEVRWYDTKSPFTFIRYQKMLFADDTQEELLDLTLSTNLGKHLNLGGTFNRANAFGFYESNKNKSTRYRIFGSYTSDRYDLYAYVANDRHRMTENGGITDLDYLRNPDKYTNGRVRIGSRDIPVLISSDRLINSLNSGHAYAMHRYKLGSYRPKSQPRQAEEKQADGKPKEGQPDSLAFVPVGSLTHTIYYNKRSRSFYARSQDDLWQKAFGPAVIIREREDDSGQLISYIQPQDSMQMTSLSNTLSLSLIEGFRPWVKFGLSAYLRNENHSVSMFDDRVGHSRRIDRFFSTFAGGTMTRTSGEGLNFSALGEVGILGRDLGALHLEGDIRTRFRIAGKAFSLGADARLLNHRPSYFASRHHGTYEWWGERELQFVRRLELGARVSLDSWGSWAEARTATLNNYIYWDASRQVQQLDDLAQVIMLRMGHTGKAGSLNWAFSAAYQTSTHEKAIPLPTLAAEGDMWLDFLLFGVLRIHLGAQAYWHTAYYAPTYVPTIQQFISQQEMQIGGGAPLLNAYANFRLKNARFYVRAYNLGEAFMDNDRLSLHRYPYNPMHFQAGIVFDLNN